MVFTLNFSLLKTNLLCFTKFSFVKNGGGAFLLLLLTLGTLNAQVGNPPIILSCNQIDVVPCLIAANQSPPNCSGCSNSAVGCTKIQYDIRLRAPANASNSNTFTLSYTNLDLIFKLAVALPNSGMTRINEDETLINCGNGLVGVDGDEVAIALQNSPFLPPGPVVVFSRSGPGLPFYAHLFTIVVDIFPSDQVSLNCTYFRYADGDDATCFYPPLPSNPNPPNPPVPNYIPPQPYMLLLSDDPFVQFGFDPAVMGATSATVPVTITSAYQFAGQDLSMTFVDFIFSLHSNIPMPKPSFQNAGSYEISILPADDNLHNDYTVIVRLKTGILKFSPGEKKVLFDMTVNRPLPHNAQCVVDLNYINGRFEGSIPNLSSFCKRMVPGGSAVQQVNFNGDPVCPSPDLSFSVSGESNPGNCNNLFVTVSLTTPVNSMVRELRFALDFDMGGPISLNGASIVNGLPCSANNLAACTTLVGSQCFKVSGNTLEYCFKVEAANAVAAAGTTTMTIPFIAASGCINNVTVREIALGVVGQGPTCVPHSAVSGFYLCPKMITVRATTDKAPNSICRIEEYRVEVTSDVCTKTDKLVDCGSQAFAECMCDIGVFTVAPKKDDNPLNGVTTYDLVLISKHILGIEALDNPYKMIAADANISNSITTFDIVEIRKLILGIYQEFPENDSWRFVDAAYTFPNPANPFQAAFPETRTVTISTTGIVDQINNFVGIKVGDVNCTAVAACGGGQCACGQKPARAERPYTLEVPSQTAGQGDVLIVPVYATGTMPLVAYQAGLKFDPKLFDFIGVSAGDVPALTPDCFNLNEAAQGRIKVLWLGGDIESDHLQSGQVLFYVALRARTNIQGESMPIETDDNIFESIGYALDGTETSIAIVARLGLEQRNTASQSMALNVTCAPNPAADNVQLLIGIDAPFQTTVSIFGPYGVRMYYRELQLDRGENSLQINDVANWPAGIYTWRVQSGKEVALGRFVKQ